MTATDIIARTRISAVWVALGGDQPKHGRARAFYRGGDNPDAVARDDGRGVGYDFRDRVGGGSLDLIQDVPTRITGIGFDDVQSSMRFRSTIDQLRNGVVNRPEGASE